jgi:hypothetical protein
MGWSTAQVDFDFFGFPKIPPDSFIFLFLAQFSFHSHQFSLSAVSFIFCFFFSGLQLGAGRFTTADWERRLGSLGSRISLLDALRRRAMVVRGSAT